MNAAARVLGRFAFCFATGAALVLYPGSAAHGAPPSLAVNGVTAADNSSIVPIIPGTVIKIAMSGTPGSRFALLFALDTNGAASGFYLKSKFVPGSFIAIHPVFDGIGTATIAQALGTPRQAFVANSPAPWYVFPAGGKVELVGRLPEQVALIDPLARNGVSIVPLLVPPDAPPPSFYLQIVSQHPVTSQIEIGNGIRVVSAPLEYPATLLAAVGEDLATGPAAISLATRTTATSLGAVDLAAGQLDSAAPSPAFAAAAGHLDLWRIELAGIQPLYLASLAANAPISGNPLDPDTGGAFGVVHAQASGMAIGTYETPTRDNDNSQFGSIELPGRRRLVHYRDATIADAQRSGFALIDEATGALRDLTPPALGSFTAPQFAPSPFECEIGVTSDGSRALVVLDGPPGIADRLFLLALSPTESFPNGHPAIEIVLPSGVNRVFEESFEFVRADDGSFVALFATSDLTSSLPGVMPNRQFALALDPAATPVQILPSANFPAIVRVDRQGVVSADRRVACLVASSNTGGTKEDVFAFRAIDAANFVVTDTTAFPVSRLLPEWYDASDGQGGSVAITASGSHVAFAVRIGTADRPIVVRTDGSDAGNAQSLVKDLGEGGLFDLVDFPACRGLHLTADGRFLLFFQGLIASGNPADRFDLFVADLLTGAIGNLTRTIEGGSLLGPWNPAGDTSTTRPTIELGGAFLSPSRGKYWFFRERRGLGSSGPDVFNAIAVDLENGPGGLPTFEMINATGTEFAPSFGSPPPPSGAPDVATNGSQSIDADARWLQLRRFASTHPAAGKAVFVARRAVAAGTPNLEQDQVLLVDLENPGPAQQLTAFPPLPAGSAQPLAPRISDLALDRGSRRVAFTLDPDAQGEGGQDAYVVDFSNTAVVTPLTASGFHLRFDSGSFHFVPTTPMSLVFVAGSQVPTLPLNDGFQIPVSPAIDPVDAQLYFHRFGIGATIPPLTIALTPPPPPGTLRVIHPLSASSP
jgi:hypothetical protein